MTDSISADYLIMGAGAAGMAFADSVFTETDATIVMVDRHDRPGGHWNDAYPFVRLHQPSSFYGVSSAPLGTGRIEEVGPNAGFYELAAGHEVLGHFDLVMRERFLPSGRVRFFPMSEVGDDRVVTSLLSGERCAVDARTLRRRDLLEDAGAVDDNAFVCRRTRRSRACRSTHSPEWRRTTTRSS